MNILSFLWQMIGLIGVIIVLILSNRNVLKVKVTQGLQRGVHKYKEYLCEKRDEA